jgi:ABC-type branched-subunit amino acid transport system ATPase component
MVVNDAEHVGEHADESPRSTVPMISLDGISVRFGGIVALADVSFEARAGEVLGIIGPNGAGKTTLFDVVSGVRAPNEGRVHLDGTDVTNRSSSWRARIGLRRTFQRVQTFGWLSVEDNILSALEWQRGGGGFLADMTAFPTRKRRERDRRQRVEEVMDRCGLLPVRDELAGSLPIGVARMVEFARAIVDTPKVLLLDEPASGLDETEIERLGTQIQAVRSETNCAVLLVEHNAGFVMEQSNRIVVLTLGSVLASGLPEEIQQNQQVRDAYLGETDPPGTSVAAQGSTPTAT